MKQQKDDKVLAVDSTYVISSRKGNGRLIRKVWVNKQKDIVKYSLVYVNFRIFQGDNGRVLGYDNDHGYHHKHYLGKIMPITFTSFAAIESSFETEFEEIHNEYS